MCFETFVIRLKLRLIHSAGLTAVNKEVVPSLLLYDRLRESLNIEQNA